MAENNGLPKGWKKVKFADVIDVVRGISFPKDAKAKEYQDGLIACLRTANVQKEVEWDDLWFVSQEYVKREEQIVQVSDILISTANSLKLVGKVALVRELPYPATLGAFISLLRPVSDLNTKFMYYLLSSEEIQSEIRSRASTTTNISNVSTKSLVDINLRIAPLPEQHRIVAKIEELFTQLDSGVAELQQAKTRLQRYRQAVLKAAVEGELTREWREAHQAELEPAEALLARILSERKAKWEAEGGKGKYQEPAEPNMEGLPDLPEGWVWASTEQIGTVNLGRQRSPKHHSGPNMRPYLRAANITWDGFDLSDVMKMNFPQATLQLIVWKLMMC